jgi:CRP-like cAMP-binding protein
LSCRYESRSHARPITSLEWQLKTVENHLIARLPRADRTRFLSLCEPVQLTLGQVLSEPGKRANHVYFPTDGFISLIAMVSGSPGVEVGMVGSEGMLGAHLSLGVTTSPLHALVQGSGAARRIPTAIFLGELAQNAQLQRSLSRYVYVLMSQLASSATCLRFHLIGQRLARWLLMSQDRAHSSSFHVTQEFLSYMLGVRRVSVTAAASALQSAGLITYHRGELTVLDRSGLEAAACGCYASDCKVYSKLL